MNVVFKRNESVFSKPINHPELLKLARRELAELETFLNVKGRKSNYFFLRKISH